MKKGFSLPITLVTVIALWVATAFGIKLSFSSWSERGQFGDMFGALNSLFSALGFVALVWTLRLQQIEIEDARKEKQHSDEVRAKEMELLTIQVESLRQSLVLQQADFNRNTTPEVKWISSSDVSPTIWRAKFVNKGAKMSVVKVHTSSGGKWRVGSPILFTGDETYLELIQDRIPDVFWFDMTMQTDSGEHIRKFKVASRGIPKET